MTYLSKPSTKAQSTVPWLGLLAASLLTLLLIVTLLPALFHSETTLQIRTQRQGNSLPDGFYVYQSLTAQGIRIKSITPADNSLVIRFESPEQSDAAEKVLRQLLPPGFDIARQEGSSVASWVNSIDLRT